MMKENASECSADVDKLFRTVAAARTLAKIGQDAAWSNGFTLNREQADGLFEAIGLLCDDAWLLVDRIHPTPAPSSKESSATTETAN